MLFIVSIDQYCQSYGILKFFLKKCVHIVAHTNFSPLPNTVGTLIKLVRVFLFLTMHFEPAPAINIIPGRVIHL